MAGSVVDASHFEMVRDRLAGFGDLRDDRVDHGGPMAASLAWIAVFSDDGPPARSRHPPRRVEDTVGAPVRAVAASDAFTTEVYDYPQIDRHWR